MPRRHSPSGDLRPGHQLTARPAVSMIVHCTLRSSARYHAKALVYGCENCGWSVKDVSSFRARQGDYECEGPCLPSTRLQRRHHKMKCLQIVSSLDSVETCNILVIALSPSSSLATPSLPLQIVHSGLQHLFPARWLL
ncbi:hypothetical protein FoTM2_017172 [Fusarium oxysporum f. sp. vasinfectum]|nr:hypothetical protein FoTM2_017172 [Fusarium oxysporum f. sp. vasinfectum]